MTDPKETNGRISLREYIETRLEAHDLLHREHTGAHDREHKATEVAIAKAETATQTALARAQETIDARFSAQNEWRAAMQDRERNFLSKAEYNSGHDAVLKRLDTLEDAEIARVTRETERERSMTRTMALIGLAATVVSVVLGILIRAGLT